MKKKIDNIKNIDDLTHRKMVLRQRMNAQRTELMTIINDLKDDLKPADLLKSAIGGLFDNSPKSNELVTTGINRGSAVLANAFVGSPKMSLAIRWLLPLVVQFAPKILATARQYLPAKSAALGFLRQGIGQLRTVIKS